MDVKKALEAVVKEVEARRPSFSKADVSRFLDREDLRGKMIGMFGRDYRKAKDVVRAGEVTLGYVFKNSEPSEGSDYHRLYVLFARNLDRLSEDPFIKFLEAYSSRENIEPTKEISSFIKLIEEPYADADMVDVPLAFSKDGLVLSIIDYRPKFFEDLRLGYNFFFVSPAMTKKAYLVHPSLIPLETYREYLEGKLVWQN